ncbi:Lrp/AsnC ligand binding domain-containing protein [Streptomyces sp. NPDC005508]|uniref:Lrp/AsnC family transcriptional regulator n=1 Tax=Streptomyces sp. NPDC005508 TaxID=3154886 RepID=UPI0033BB4D1A
MLGDRVLHITAIANPRSVGFEMQVWVAIRGGPGQGIEALVQLLTKIPSITYVVACAGRFDIFAEAVCRDAKDVMRLIDSEIRTLPGVEQTELLMCLDLYYRACVLRNGGREVGAPRAPRLCPVDSGSPAPGPRTSRGAGVFRRP